MILKEGWGGVGVRFLGRHSCKLEAGLGLYEARDLVRFSEDVDESWMASTICTHRCTVNEGGKAGKYPVYVDFRSTPSVVIRIRI